MLNSATDYQMAGTSNAEFGFNNGMSGSGDGENSSKVGFYYNNHQLATHTNQLLLYQNQSSNQLMSNNHVGLQMHQSSNNLHHHQHHHLHHVQQQQHVNEHYGDHQHAVHHHQHTHHQPYYNLNQQQQSTLDLSAMSTSNNNDSTSSSSSSSTTTSSTTGTQLQALNNLQSNLLNSPAQQQTAYSNGDFIGQQQQQQTHDKKHLRSLKTSSTLSQMNPTKSSTNCHLYLVSQTNANHNSSYRSHHEMNSNDADEEIDLEEEDDDEDEDDDDEDEDEDDDEEEESEDDDEDGANEYLINGGDEHANGDMNKMNATYRSGGLRYKLETSETADYELKPNNGLSIEEGAYMNSLFNSPSSLSSSSTSNPQLELISAAKSMGSLSRKAITDMAKKSAAATYKSGPNNGSKTSKSVKKSRANKANNNMSTSQEDSQEMDATSNNNSYAFNRKHMMSSNLHLINSFAANSPMDDYQLVTLPLRELNKRLRALPKSVAYSLKKRRRTLKNRKYAQNCRSKRLEQKSEMEIQNGQLKTEIVRLNKLIEKLQRENYLLKSPYKSNGGHVQTSSTLSELLGDNGSMKNGYGQQAQLIAIESTSAPQTTAQQPTTTNQCHMTMMSNGGNSQTPLTPPTTTSPTTNNAINFNQQSHVQI